MTLALVQRNEFKLTKRRKEILWHVAYTDEIVFGRGYYRAGARLIECLEPLLDGVNIRHPILALKKSGLIRWPMGRPMMWITPFGMEVLLNGLPEIESLDTR